MKIKIFVIISLLNTFYINAQDKKSYLSINFIFSHYIPDNSNESQNGDAPYNIGPGAEFLYNYKLSSSLKFGTGLSYQYVDMISYTKASDKFKFGELSLPVLLTLEGKNGISFETGIYAGKFLHFEWYKHSHSQWTKTSSNNSEFGYESRNTFADLYLAISFPFNKKEPRSAQLCPFIRYRFYENWMNHYRESSYYGIKFTVSLSKNKNDEKN